MKVLHGEILLPSLPKKRKHRAKALPTVRSQSFSPEYIASIAAPDPSGRQRIVWDRDLPGFGILISGRTRARSWVVQRSGQTRRVIERVELMGLEEARDVALVWLRQMAKGEDPKEAQREERKKAAVSSLTLRTAHETRLSVKKTMRPSTRVWYERLLRGHLSDWMDRPLSSITAAEIQDRHAHIFETVKYRNGTSAAASANGTIRALAAIIRFTRRRHPELASMLVHVGDAMTDTWIKEQERSRRINDDDLPKAFRVIMAWPNRFQRDAVLLLLFLGLRKLEALGLRWEEVNLDKRVILLPEARTKAKRQFLVPLSDFAVKLLTDLRKRGRDESGFVFFGYKAGRHISEPRDLLEAISKAIGYKIGCHDLRRTFASTAHNHANVPWLDLQRLLNHATPHVTARYAVADPEPLRGWQQQTTNALLRLCKATQKRAPGIQRRELRPSA